MPRGDGTGPTGDGVTPGRRQMRCKQDFTSVRRTLGPDGIGRGQGGTGRGLGRTRGFGRGR